MRWVISLLFAAAFPSTGFAGEPPREFVRRFYAVYKTWPIRGVPLGDEEKFTAPYFGTDVIRIFRRVNEQREQWEHKYPFDAANPVKPPWCTEGDVFCDVWEGITHYSIGKVSNTRRGVIVEANLELVYDGKTSAWTDRILLDRAGNSWVIADIIYATGSTLLTSIEKELQANARYLKAP